MYLDLEVYPNYFLAMVMSDSGKIGYVDMHDDAPLDIDKLSKLLGIKDTYYTFNGTNFDIPLVKYALCGATSAQLKSACDRIITDNTKHWQFSKMYSQATLDIDHVDLIEVAPGMNSLKTYGGRMHCTKLQELPISPSSVITTDQVNLLRRYCKNDLVTTRELHRSLTKQIALREVIRESMLTELTAVPDASLLFSVDDLRSKSDAQIAESVLKHRVFCATGAVPRKIDTYQPAFACVLPKYLRFRSPELQSLLSDVQSAVFTIKDTGHVQMPATLVDREVRVNGTLYRVGIGGLHSQEEGITRRAHNTEILRDIDVESYYPTLMLNLGLYPTATGPHFLTAYAAIRNERLAAKHAGDKVKSDVLKITLNGSYGKTSSKYSILYNPQMTLATTMTGQLSMLMLIELLELGGIPVVSANTDGIVVHYTKEKEHLQRRIVSVWGKVCNLNTEETNYRAIFSRDVNSYIAIKLDGSVKCKGYFADTSLNKSPTNEVCRDALLDVVTNCRPIDVSIRACSDIRKFVSLRNVRGGAIDSTGTPIGKLLRWYYAKGVDSTFRYATNGNIVPRSRGAKLLMDLPNTLPDDIDYEWYIREANELYMDVGAISRPPKPRLPRRNTKEWKDLEANGLVEVTDGQPQWAVPYHNVPAKYKVTDT
jgi:hypothetical protein